MEGATLAKVPKVTPKPVMEEAKAEAEERKESEVE